MEELLTEDYPYKGLPITSEIIEVLITKLFNGQTAGRREIDSKVLDYHIRNGGLKSESKNYPPTVKRALVNLREKGFSYRVKAGVWRIHERDAPNFPIEGDPIEIEKLPTHMTYGKGDYSIYLYFFPSYKALAELKGKNTWPCKIGKSERDPLIRILTQTSTALPEVPSIEFIIKTNNSNLLETLIHAILKVHNKHIIDSPGSEWFDTNPEEVLNFIKIVKEDILL